MTRVAEVMDKLPRKFQPNHAIGLAVVFQIDIEDGEPYSIQVSEGTCTVTQQQHPDPDVTLFMTSDIFVGIIEGEFSGTGAFLSGSLRAEGDVMLATKLSSLFKR